MRFLEVGEVGGARKQLIHDLTFGPSLKTPAGSGGETSMIFTMSSVPFYNFLT